MADSAGTGGGAGGVVGAGGVGADGAGGANSRTDGASGAIVNFILYSFSTFISAFLTRYHGLNVAQAGVWSGLGSGAAGILGALAAGAFGDRTRGAGRLRLAAIAAALAALPGGTGLLACPAAVAALLLMLAYGLLQMYYGLVYAAIQDIVAPGLRGTAMAAYYTVMYLGGGAFGPLITGRLSDSFAHRAAGGPLITEAARAAGLHHAMYLVPALSLALAAVLSLAARSMAAAPPATAAHPPR